MAVKKTSESGGEAKYTINNGDLEALNKIKEQYKLKDSDSAIVFAIGLLSQSNGRPVTITKDDGTLTSLIPSENLRQPRE